MLDQFEGFSISLTNGISSITLPLQLYPSPSKISLLIINPRIPPLLNPLLRLPPPSSRPLLLGDSAGACKSLCSIACFVCDKYDSTLCARCYVRGNFRVGPSNANFRRVQISDEAKIDWSDKETLLLLEAIMQYGDDWKKVELHVGGRTEKDCVTHLVKLPFGEEYLGHPFSDNADSGLETNKRMRLTPLVDASNPIMAQAAFLSALAGVEIAEAAAQAAVNLLSKVNDTTASRGDNGSLERNRRHESEISSNVDTYQNAFERANTDANSQKHDKEEQDIERAIRKCRKKRCNNWRA